MADKTARILIVGGGFGGVFTALALAGACEVTLVSTEDHFLFTPMLYEYLSGEVEAWHIAPQYKELLDERVRFIRGEVTDIDLVAREAGIAERAERVPYDVLVLAVGGITNYAGVEGAEEHTIPFRKIAHADALRQRMVEALDRVPPDFAPQDVRRALTFAVVGAGASGVELSTKMADLLRDAFKRRALRHDRRDGRPGSARHGRRDSRLCRGCLEAVARRSPYANARAAHNDRRARLRAQRRADGDRGGGSCLDGRSSHQPAHRKAGTGKGQARPRHSRADASGARTRECLRARRHLFLPGREPATGRH